jgi:prefoldin alpha subunit
MNQEQIFQIQLIEQESNQLNQQLELIQQNMIELQELKLSLGEIKNTKQTEFLVNIGKRIYAPVEIKDKRLIIEVGNKTFIRKDIDGTIEIIDEQLKKLENANNKIMINLTSLQEQANRLMLDIEKNRNKHDHKSHKCDCEDGKECDCSKDDCDEEDCDCKH